MASTSSTRENDFEDDGSVVNRDLNSEEVVSLWNLIRLYKKLGTNEQCVAFAEENGLVHSQKQCSTHRKPMKIAKSTNKTFGSWCCTKGNCRSKTKVPRNKGTFFENIKIELVHVFYLLYAFSQNWSYLTTMREDPYKDDRLKSLSRVTICDWYSYCRETIVIYQMDKTQAVGKIGGPGKIVQIDESKFGKRKYNRGRHIEGYWVLGMIEDKSEDLRLEVCPNNIRSADILLPLIQKHVEVGTIIHTDFWKAYDCLADHGYIHQKVNHSDPENPFVAEDGTHTQRIESQWRAVKRFFKKDNYNNTENFSDHVYEYLWRRNNIKYKKDPFLELIKAVKYVYKLNTD
ncbi:uncharacterized protein LOC125063808 [Pieris napi]|uniref:uncharacterized protein LOC125063808 n=1 Tax=Pieris napi TaxID=78633 RepID=UPI001FB87893|nr:uncharacterized protein LOC125063808 [Pieris napi]XP_047526407.1 uncharacterized protein LOC125063808 [Pieris napi]XP_047526408.1 uncharacterized protein LOC125063808 [Pieris napi]